MRTLILLFAVAAVAGPATADDATWPSWRGTTSNGVAPNARPPLKWSEGSNVRWKTELPGTGQASPIVWGDRVYVQTAVDTGKEGPAVEEADEPGRRRGRKPTTLFEFSLLSIDRASGKIVWQTKLAEAVPHEGVHPDSSHASTSPVTDGKHIYAWFGSRGLFCVDLDGKVVWEKQFGKMYTRNSFGEGGAPLLHDDLIIVLWDHEGDDDFLVACDKKTGEERWRVARDEPTTWSSPILLPARGGPQVAVNAHNKIRSYDLKTGRLVWECGGMTMNVIPTLVYDDERVYAISGFRGNALVAIKYHEAKGDVTGTDAVAWSYEGKGTPYVPSPTLYNGLLYFLDNNRAILSCLDGQTGEVYYGRQRIEEVTGAYASLVAANGRIYLAARDGNTAVIKAGEDYELLAVNALDDVFDASPALVGKEMFLRGRKHLYCIAE